MENVNNHPTPPCNWDVRTQGNRGSCNIVDGGDVDILPLLSQGNFGRIRESVANNHAHGTMPTVLGCGHSISFPALSI